MRLALAIALALLAGCSQPAARGGWGASSRDALAAGGAPVARSVSTLQDTPAAAARFDAAVLRFVNRARATHGQPPLRPDPRLARAAGDHAANMAALGTHSHRLPVRGQARLADRMHRQGVDYRIAGENIGMEKLFRLAGRPISVKAAGCRFTYAETRQIVPPHDVETLAEAAVARWMASPKHRASILRAGFRRTGSGFGIDPGGPACGDVYLAQTFAD